MKRLGAGLMLAVVAVAGPAKADCLSDVADFAIKICGEIVRSGTKTTVTADGKVEGSISSIIRRIVGGGTASVSGSFARETFENIAQQSLPSDIVDNRQCRNTMVAVAIPRLCRTAVQYKVCQNPDFGLKGWASSIVVESNSGWMGGGHSRPEWCNTLANATIGSRQIKAHQVTVLATDEGQRWAPVRHRQYNYYCKIKIDYDPIFNSRRDALCGVEPE